MTKGSPKNENETKQNQTFLHGSYLDLTLFFIGRK